MKFLFNLFLLFPFLVFSQSEVKIEYWDNGKILSLQKFGMIIGVMKIFIPMRDLLK